MQPCKSNGLNWPFLRFSGAFSECNAGFPQWRGLAETLGTIHARERGFINILGWRAPGSHSRQNFCTKIFWKRIFPLEGQARHRHSWSNHPDLCMNLNFAVKIVEVPMWLSISTIFSTLAGSISGDVILFSTASTTPSDVCIPIAVDPSYKWKIRSLSIYSDLSIYFHSKATGYIAAKLISF